MQTPNAGQITQVNLIRLSSVTHSFNMNQRLNHLPFTVIPGGLTLTAPAQATDCPPGHYLLFLINANGVPSPGSIIRIGPGLSSTCPTTLNLSLEYEEQFVASCDIIADFTVSASAPVSNYRWSIDGVYNPSFDGMNTISLHIFSNQPTRQVQVAALPVCGGAAAIAGQTFNTYFPNCSTPTSSSQ